MPKIDGSTLAQSYLLMLARVLISAVVSGITSVSANRPPLNQAMTSLPNVPPWAMASNRVSNNRGSMAGFALAVSSSLPNSPAGSRPVSSPNMQNMSFIRKWAARSGSIPLSRIPSASLANRWAASTVIFSLVMPGRSELGSVKSLRRTSRLAGSARPARSKTCTCLAVPVKFVWTSKRSMSQTTSSGGFSRASRYSSSWE